MILLSLSGVSLTYNIYVDIFCRLGDLESVKRLQPLEPAKRLWVRGLRRLQTQIRVVSAFRNVNEFRRRVNVMANYALEAPVSVQVISLLFTFNAVSIEKPPTWVTSSAC